MFATVRRLAAGQFLLVAVVVRARIGGSLLDERGQTDRENDELEHLSSGDQKRLSGRKKSISETIRLSKQTESAGFDGSAVLKRRIGAPKRGSTCGKLANVHPKNRSCTGARQISHLVGLPLVVLTDNLICKKKTILNFLISCKCRPVKSGRARSYLVLNFGLNLDSSRTRNLAAADQETGGLHVFIGT